MNILDAPKRAIYNAESIKNKQCGCYYCIRAFDGNDVTEFCDSSRTALCPHCGIDSVLAGEVCIDLLTKLNKIWFQGEGL